MSKICYGFKNHRIGCYDTHHTRDDMNTQFASKCIAASTRGGHEFDPNLTVHQASFQAYKRNEDRIAVLGTEYGVIVGVFDGHYDASVSEYAARNLLKELDERISAEMISKNHPDDDDSLDEVLPVCLIDTIEQFDAKLHQTLIDGMRESSESKPWSEWTADDIAYFLGMKELGEHDPYPVMRRSCTGSTALVAVVFKTNRSRDHESGEQSMWVASLGDSEGILGRVVNDIWTATPLNDLHNVNNQAEVQRLQVEHPGEDDLIQGGRTKHILMVTRALGNAMLKLPLDLAKVLTMMWGSPIWPEQIAGWSEPNQKHTPPYISSTPSITRFSVRKGDILVFASDGMRSSLTEEGVPDEDVGEILVSLAAMDVLPVDDEALLSCEKIIGHSFIPCTDIQNMADRMIRNILFGLDDDRMAKETMATMDRASSVLRDDMSVVTVHIA